MIAAGRAAEGRPEREDGDPAGPALQQGQEVAQAVGLVDDQQAALGRGQLQDLAHPGRQIRLAFHMALGTAWFGRGGEAAGGMEGRIGQHEIETAGGDGGGRPQQIALVDRDPALEAVQPDILPGEAGQGRLQLQPGDLHLRQAPGEAEGGSAHAAAQIEHATLGCRRRGGQEDGIDAGRAGPWPAGAAAEARPGSHPR